ncbi:hypothetical protein L208DRAFT_1379406 [Tricholoma matsutake]|nr:hypothetical protein L208DRAFT_1379406 [Tricholoma matsutake 945]
MSIFTVRELLLTDLWLESQQGHFAIGSRDFLKPGVGELSVKVQALAVALNPLDWKVRQGIKFSVSDPFPLVLGIDITGDVVEVGEGVTSFSKGDRVFFLIHDFQCCYDRQDPNQSIVRGSFHYSTTILVTAAAYVGMFHPTKLRGLQFSLPLEPSQRGQMAGTPFVVLGEAPSGSSILPFHELLDDMRGLSPIITTSSLKHAEFLNPSE